MEVKRIVGYIVRQIKDCQRCIAVRSFAKICWTQFSLLLTQFVIIKELLSLFICGSNSIFTVGLYWFICQFVLKFILNKGLRVYLFIPYSNVWNLDSMFLKIMNKKRIKLQNGVTRKIHYFLKDFMYKTFIKGFCLEK